MQTDLWAVPLFVNARVSVPILIFEPYIGGGIGGICADYDAGASFANDDFVLAYDAFLGLEVGLGNLALGAEYKYVQSEDTKDGFAIEGGGPLCSSRCRSDEVRADARQPSMRSK